MTPFAALSLVALAVYFAAASSAAAGLILRGRRAGRPEGGSRPSWIPVERSLVLLGIALQTAATGFWCATKHVSPFASAYGTLSVLAWVVAAAYLCVDLRFRMPAMGAIALPLTCLILLFGLLHVEGPVADRKILETQVISLHVAAILLSYSLFACAFGCAALYLLATRLLKGRRPARALRYFPPLGTLDRVAFETVAFGLPLLTLGIGLGAMYEARLGEPPRFWLMDPHNLVAYATWLLYGFYMAARLALGWRGVRLQYLLLAGLVIALALYFVPSPTHHFGGA